MAHTQLEHELTLRHAVKICFRESCCFCFARYLAIIVAVWPHRC